MIHFIKKNKKIVFSLTFLLVLIFITFFMIFKNYDINLLFETLKSANVGFIILAFLMVFLYLIFESLSTRSILKSLNEETSFIHNFKYSCIDYYYCYITPSASGGQPVVGYYMTKDHVKLENVSISLLFNTLQFKIVLLVLGILSMIITPHFIFGNGPLLIVLFMIGFVLNVGMVILCFMGIYADQKLTRAGFWILNLLYKMRIIKFREKYQAKLLHKMKSYKESAQLISQHKAIFFKAFFYNLFQRIAIFSVGYFVYLSFGQGNLSFFKLICVQVIVALSVDTLPLPGGVLITETLMLLLYKQIYIEGLIVPAMLVTRAISYYFSLLFTLSVIIFTHILKAIKEKKSQRKEELLHAENQNGSSE